MAKVRIINSTPGAITLMAYNLSGQLEMAVIPAANNQAPGEALVDESLLELLEKKGDRAVKARFDAGHLRLAKSNTVPEEQKMTPVPEDTPVVTPEPAVPAVPPAPAADDVPEVTGNTPPDAPWATGNK